MQGRRGISYLDNRSIVIWVAQSPKMEDVQRRFGKELQLRKKLSIKEENYSEESSRKDSRKEW